MASLLNTSSTVTTTTRLPSHASEPQVLAILHSDELMLTLNPLLKSHTPLSASAATAFHTAVAKDLKPRYTSTSTVYHCVEAQASSSSEEAGTWRGGWAKKFIPDEIIYDTSMQATDDGMFAVTHAPMGVHSVTTWVVKEDGEGLVLEKTGKVTSNRALMVFIKTTLQESYDKLARDFVGLVERELGKRDGEEVEGQPVGEKQAEVEVVA